MTSDQQIIAEQAAEIERLKSKVASLEDQLYWLRKKMFGKMSEKNLPLDPDALDEDSRSASEALAYINRLYHIENESKDAGIVGEALKEKRQKEAYPVILQFEKWMNEMARKASQNSRIGKAIKYTFPLLPRLGRYVNDGRFCIDNNLVENAIRPLALGRKNYLFCGNHDAAVRAAIVYSLVDTCKALDVDPRLWLEDVLLRIPGNEDNRAALRNLLPDRWKSN